MFPRVYWPARMFAPRHFSQSAGVAPPLPDLPRFPETVGLTRPARETVVMKGIVPRAAVALVRPARETVVLLGTVARETVALVPAPAREVVRHGEEG